MAPAAVATAGLLVIAAVLAHRQVPASAASAGWVLGRPALVAARSALVAARPAGLRARLTDANGASWPPPSVRPLARGLGTGPGGVLDGANGVEAAPLPASPGWAPGSSALVPAAWTAPLDPAVLLRPFDPPPRDWQAGHRGVDLRAGSGKPVRAMGAGVVRFAGAVAGRGVVVVDHGRLRTSYEPVDPLVSVGDPVSRGQLLGVVSTGSGHCGDGSCLHLGLRRGSTYLDPLLLLGRPVAVLRPW